MTNSHSSSRLPCRQLPTLEMTLSLHRETRHARHDNQVSRKAAVLLTYPFSSVARMASICSGPTPQQPPRIVAPLSHHSLAQALYAGGSRS